jgi:hypothetical protein
MFLVEIGLPGVHFEIAPRLHKSILHITKPF